MPRWLILLLALTATIACADTTVPQSDAFIPLFSRLHNVPEAEIREALNNCDSDRNIRFCQWFYRFSSEIELKDQVARLASAATKACASQILASQRRWEQAERKRCEDEATEDTGYWGRRQQELLEICLRMANVQRSGKLSSIAKCSPCSLCD